MLCHSLLPTFAAATAGSVGSFGADAVTSIHARFQMDELSPSFRDEEFRLPAWQIDEVANVPARQVDPVDEVGKFSRNSNLHVLGLQLCVISAPQCVTRM
jgi:hypothetical protein